MVSLGPALKKGTRHVPQASPRPGDLNTELVFQESWGRGAGGPKLHISVITLLFLKKHDWHIFTIKTSGCWTLTKKKIPSFSHTSKADVTFFTRWETETAKHWE